MGKYSCTMIDATATPTRTSLPSATPKATPAAAPLEALDKLTHCKITGMVDIVGQDLSGATLKAAPSVGDYDDKTYKLNLTFKDADGNVVKKRISAPNAKKGGGLATQIYLLDERGGIVPATLPTGGVGISGNDLATQVEIINGLTAGSLSFLSGSLTKSSK